MALQRSSGSIKKSPLKKGKPIRKLGPRAKAWLQFRNAKAERDRDEDGLLQCEDWKIGLPKCGIGRPSLDLHHTKGRDGGLLTDERFVVWVTRSCHDAAHNNTNSTRTETEDDSEGSLG